MWFIDFIINIPVSKSLHVINVNGCTEGKVFIQYNVIVLSSRFPSISQLVVGFIQSFNIQIFQLIINMLTTIWSNNIKQYMFLLPLTKRMVSELRFASNIIASNSRTVQFLLYEGFEPNLVEIYKQAPREWIWNFGKYNVQCVGRGVT